MVSRGPDLDVLSVRMAVDVTSPDQLTFNPTGPDLFSFTSASVERLDDHFYRAEGLLSTSTGKHPLDLMIEVPDGHNAFFSLGFSGRKEVLGNVWPELMATSGVGDLDAERRMDPRAGVRAADLAAA